MTLLLLRQQIAMAMSEASALFDKSGGAAGGNKQDAVNSAAQMIMKFLLKSQLSGEFVLNLVRRANSLAHLQHAIGAMGTGGGAGGLMSMASK